MNKKVEEINRYDSMQYRRCGNSGLKLPIISLGLWHNFGTNDCFENMREILTTAFDHGVTHFDLANNYGPLPGSAESNFGKILGSDFQAHRDEMIISTKAGYLMWDGPYGEWGSRKHVLSSLDQSLQRMGIDYVDIFYSHRPDPETPLEETMGALHTALQSGKALYVGLSNYSAEMTVEASRILRDMGSRCLIYQGPYNMFDRGMEQNHFQLFKEEGIGSILFSPLAQGLLSDRYMNGIPDGSRASQEHFLKSERVQSCLPKVKKLGEVGISLGMSISQLALAWILNRESATSALVGASSSSQLLENLKVVQHNIIPIEAMTEIDRILRND